MASIYYSWYKLWGHPGKIMREQKRWHSPVTKLWKTSKKLVFLNQSTILYIVWLKTSFLEAFQRLALFEKWARDDGSDIALDLPTISRIIWKFMWKFQYEKIDSIVFFFRHGALSFVKQNRRQCLLRQCLLRQAMPNRSNLTRVLTPLRCSVVLIRLTWEAQRREFLSHALQALP